GFTVGDRAGARPSEEFCFSSRRRHTRFSRDWSSDVCSSDLLRSVRNLSQGSAEKGGRLSCTRHWGRPGFGGAFASPPARAESAQIGRASCREREQTAGAAGGGKGTIWRRAHYSVRCNARRRR